jgi:hypothetical protein
MIPNFNGDFSPLFDVFASKDSRLPGRHENSVFGEQCSPTMSVVIVDQFDKSGIQIGKGL